MTYSAPIRKRTSLTICTLHMMLACIYIASVLLQLAHSTPIQSTDPSSTLTPSHSWTNKPHRRPKQSSLGPHTQGFLDNPCFRFPSSTVRRWAPCSAPPTLSRLSLKYTTMEKSVPSNSEQHDIYNRTLGCKVRRLSAQLDASM